ncbi:hypothetical protein ADIS_3266 [Lunatimonas lonarensis]|uniref:Uncharacterized protein n=1 Tax=Lunatimonas lonarensis TaxID=1232681 RepID=R7ZQ13_9BACT|nr:hypothetical protein [Lunatimonas lonarensis]EON76138.1 hypothetical protein ADIS_3266 [Lunatimonas lonarensis]
MNNERYFLTLLAGCLVGMLAVIGINRQIDIFGLYRNHTCEGIGLHGEERYSKYLHMHRYVPECFDGIWMGASLSANLDPSRIRGFRIYNASLMGARIGQLEQLYSTAVDQGADFEVAIISIHPYLTGETEKTDTHLAKKGLQSAMGSVSLLRVYALALIRKFKLWESKYPQNQYSSEGRNDYNRFFEVPDIVSHIQKKIHDPELTRLASHEEGLHSLQSLLEQINQTEARILLYFHPIPADIYRANREILDSYWTKITEMPLRHPDKVLLININQHPSAFNKDLSNYIDHGHLSELGQERLLSLMNQELEKTGHFKNYPSEKEPGHYKKPLNP